MPPYGACSANKRHRCYTQAHFLRRAHPAAVAPRHIQLQISVLLPPPSLENCKNARRCLIFLWASSHISAFPNSQSRAPHPQCTDTALSLPGCWEHGARGEGWEHFKLAGTAGICTALIFLSNNSVPSVGGRGQGAQQRGCLLPRTHRASPSLGQRGYLGEPGKAHCKQLEGRLQERRPSIIPLYL